MARLIDADALLDEFLKRYTERERNRNLVFAACEIKQEFADMISDFHTVDAVPVVRCKGCKHAYINSFSAASGVALCMLLSKRTEGIQVVMKQDDFCSFGERKDGDD